MTTLAAVVADVKRGRVGIMVSMRTGEARAVAAAWVGEQAATLPGFEGAFFSGSTIWRADEAEQPAGSDVDVMVVVSGPAAPPKLGKLVHDGVLVEVTYLPWESIRSAEVVLSSYHLAGCFRTDTVIADPTGRLAALVAGVSARYAEPAWIRRRCDDAATRIENGLRHLDPARPWHELVTGWLFPTGVTTHLLLTAGLRNPTVRLRYLAARTLLDDHGRPEVYADLLELLGCADLTAERTTDHLRTLAGVFDTAAAVARTPYFFSSDITAAARPVAIDGSRALVDAGDHREAVFWMVATYARCLTILAADAPDRVADFAPGFAAVLGDLGVATPDDLGRRAGRTLAELPRLREVAEQLVAEGPRG